MKTTIAELRKIIKKVITEANYDSGTRPYGSGGGGGRYNSRGKLIPRGGSEISMEAQDAWNFITDMGAPAVSPSFFEEGKLMRFSLDELKALHFDILFLHGPEYKQWEKGAYMADEFLAKLQEHIELRGGTIVPGKI